jgi:hypothetical protein
LNDRIIENKKNIGIVDRRRKWKDDICTVLLALDPAKRKELKKGEIKNAPR